MSESEVGLTPKSDVTSDLSFPKECLESRRTDRSCIHLRVLVYNPKVRACDAHEFPLRSQKHVPWKGLRK